VGLRFDLRPSQVQSRCSITWATILTRFVPVTLELKSGKLFVWTGFELWSFWLQPLRELRCCYTRANFLCLISENFLEPLWQLTFLQPKYWANRGVWSHKSEARSCLSMNWLKYSNFNFLNWIIYIYIHIYIII
jgi:hypothetical protein